MPFEAVNALNYSGHYDGERLHEAAHSLDSYGIELVSFGSVGPIAEIACFWDADELAIPIDPVGLVVGDLAAPQAEPPPEQTDNRCLEIPGRWELATDL
jgi:hypothetical protein